MSDEEPTPEERRALFRVVRGEPSDAEVAALAVVLAAAATAGAGAPRRPRPGTAGPIPAARLRAPLHPGPGRLAHLHLAPLTPLTPRFVSTARARAAYGRCAQC